MIDGMAKKDKQARKPHAGRRGLSVSLYPLKPDEALGAVLRIKPEDVKRIVGKKGKG